MFTAHIIFWNDDLSSYKIHPFMVVLMALKFSINILMSRNEWKKFWGGNCIILTNVVRKDLFVTAEAFA